MKKATITKFMMLCCLMVSTAMSYAQEWNIPVEIEGAWGFTDVVPVDNGECALGIGSKNGNDGLVMKIGKDGTYTYRVVHLPGMMLCYHTAVQLDDGNYMAFGICDDSLCDPHYQRYLRVDVFDGQLQSVSSKTYNVDDDVFDFFVFPDFGSLMSSILSLSGNALLAAAPARYVEQYGYYDPAIRFYEFDNLGDTIRTVDNPPLMSSVGYIKEITYEPHSDNLMIVVQGGSYGYNSGDAGVFVADAELNIVAHQSMRHLGGAERILDNACEGRWVEDNRIIFDCEQFIGSNFTYHTLYVADSALNTYAELRLPPYDSCTRIPNNTSTAYSNDSTVFAITYCNEEGLGSLDDCQVNVILTDKHLNLLGRKIIKMEETQVFAWQPVAFNDGGCLVSVVTRNNSNYQGGSFNRKYLMKFRREDIEITWDVVKEPGALRASSAYPNPTRHRVNITTDGAFAPDARLQVFDARGVKCLDCAVGQSGGLITLDVQNLDAGLYLYKVASGNRVFSSGKFIKE